MEDKISIKKSTFRYIIIGIFVAAVFSAFIAGYLIGNGNMVLMRDDSRPMMGPMPTPTNTQTTSEKQEDVLSFVSLDDDPMKGDPNAPITIIEFSDYQCPFCKKFHETTLPLLETNFINTGKANFVYRDFPIISIHPNAVPAALAAECADDQGKYWQYHDLLFINQGSWSKIPTEQAVMVFEQYGDQLNLDSEEFNQCLRTAKYGIEVNQDLNDGKQYGITGTPGFFVGNEQLGYVRIPGAQPYPVFEQVITTQLARMN